MLTFMDYVVRSFGDQIGWNRDNSYSSLTATADGIEAQSLECFDLYFFSSFPLIYSVDADH